MLTVATPFVLFFYFCSGALAAEPQLSGCWDVCTQRVSGGRTCDWDDTGCACDIASSTSYLSNIVSCAQKSCARYSAADADSFLSAISSSCSDANKPIDQSRLDDAQAEALNGQTQQQTSTSLRGRIGTAVLTVSPSTTHPSGSAATTNGLVIAGSGGGSGAELTFSPTETLPRFTPTSKASTKGSGGGDDGSLFGYQGESAAAGGVSGRGVAVVALLLSIGVAVAS